MRAYLSTMRRSGEWRETGTGGRTVIGGSRHSVIRAAAKLQRAWGDSPVRIEEAHEDSPYRVARVWTYHCPCDPPHTCRFHGGEAEGE